MKSLKKSHTIQEMSMRSILESLFASQVFNASLIPSSYFGQRRWPFLCGLLIFVFAGSLQGETRELHGSTYVSLPKIASQLGMKLQWIQPQKEVELKSKWTTLRFELHQRHFFLNGRKVALGNPVALSRGQLFISQRDIQKTLQPLLTPQIFAESSPKLYHIVIDPGHGGHDPGAENRKLRVNEKSTTLDLAKRMKKKLERLGYKVTLTRDTDKFISLGERPAIANRVKADLFISLHFNAVASSKVKGLETFAMTPAGHPSSSQSNMTSSARRTYPGNKNDTWNVLAAYYLQSAMLKNHKQTDRGVKRARFAVLKNLNCPGVLVEGGFVTHPTEGKNIGSAAYREKLADSLVEGILTYQKTLNRVRGR
ncbi:N-acetylmuramoyl-L-alanine amidase [Rubellicoccus peritrichatus]|uniref:N-acetylmuramoyl-L-alanine amidase n=1 Tax=Rubellicoccus peritrichatus TaxID=3080537 RepID=A0AAQ3LDX8_9BACT|nr:N-acetylmuramoyl-L-alanine amidase [Puniceicoccus sp. CR14]WOO42669.1 N-acetylmuramoyl-L-alanine amidase [Puniceicoccus sp. CR14]